MTFAHITRQRTSYTMMSKLRVMHTTNSKRRSVPLKDPSVQIPLQSFAKTDRAYAACIQMYLPPEIVHTVMSFLDTSSMRCYVCCEILSRHMECGSCGHYRVRAHKACVPTATVRCVACTRSTTWCDTCNKWYDNVECNVLCHCGQTIHHTRCSSVEVGKCTRCGLCSGHVSCARMHEHLCYECRSNMVTCPICHITLFVDDTETQVCTSCTHHVHTTCIRSNDFLCEVCVRSTVPSYN